VRLLRDLNENKKWRELVGNRSKRLKDQELILRFFALRSRGSDYEAPMKEFLNRYAGWNRDLDREPGLDLRRVFETTTLLIHDRIGPRAFRPQRAVNAAVVDSLMTVVAQGLRDDKLVGPATFPDAYKSLLKDTEYRGAIERATAREENVELRLARARAHLLS